MSVIMPLSSGKRQADMALDRQADYPYDRVCRQPHDQADKKDNQWVGEIG